MGAHAGPSHDGLPKGAVVLAGRVVDVDPLRWTCRVRTEILDKNVHDVQIGGSYLHPVAGEGIYAMPRVPSLRSGTFQDLTTIILVEVGQ